MKNRPKDKLLQNSSALRNRIQEKLGTTGLNSDHPNLTRRKIKNESVVLVILSDCSDAHGALEPCLILNKRSSMVRQAGDLCYPGGGLSWGVDRLLASLLSLPGSPLGRWSTRRRWRKQDREVGRALSILLAAGLREAWEEMRLNPLGLAFLGVLPEQHLVMFKRTIYPLVGWVPAQVLKPNWEVDRIVNIPLRKLLDPGYYGRFRPMVSSIDGDRIRQLRIDDFPCFIHEDEWGREMLWGATYRITQSFLESVFGFVPPEMDNLPLVHRRLEGTYLSGSRWDPQAIKRNHEADW